MIDFGLKKIFRSKPRNRAGLDIDGNLIKMLEVSGAPEEISLVSFGTKKVQGSTREGIIDSVKALAGELKISVREFTIALAGPSVVARLISMPKMTEEELRNAIMFEIEKFIPFDAGECVLDFQVQGIDAREQNNVNILLAAVKRDFVLQKIKIMEEAGFDVNVVDVDSFAVTNAFLKNFASSESAKTISLLNIGATCTNLIILKGGLISSVRDIAIGTNDFNAAISSGLLDEIKLSFGYHENQSGRGIDEIYLSGGGVNFPGIAEAFGETLGPKPQEWNPFEFMDIDPAKINVDELTRVKDSFAVAVGLALR